MEISNIDETHLINQQKDGIAKKFINTLEKITGTKVLNTQSDYNLLSDFSFRIINESDIKNSMNTLYLTEEEIEIVVDEIKSLANQN